MLPWLVFAMSTVLTGMLWHAAREHAERNAHDQFAARADRIALAIASRMQAYGQLLRGGASLFSVVDEVDGAAWRRYIDNLDIGDRYPGVQAIGFAPKVSTAGLDAYLARMRRRVDPGYAIRPAGSRPYYTPVTMVERFGTSDVPALGFDMASEPVRRAAMEQAMLTGALTVSGKVGLIRHAGPHPHPGFLMFLPVYRPGMPHDTPGRRAAALLGYVYTPMHAQDMMRGILGADPADIDFRVYDGEGMETEALLYADDGFRRHAGPAFAPAFTEMRRLTLDGRVWTLRFESPDYRTAVAAHSSAPAVLAAGATISMLFFAIAWSLATSRKRALALAQKMTAALKRNVRQMRLIADNVPALIAYVDERQRFVFANRQYEEAFGVPHHALKGMRIPEVLGEDVYGQSKPHLDRALQGARVCFEREVHRRGTVRHERVSYVPEVDDRGKVTGLFSLVEDITALAQAQRTLAAGELRLRLITDNIPALVAYIDSEQRYRFCNEQYRTMLGVDPASMLGRTITEIFGHRWQRGLQEEIRQALDGRPVSFERCAPRAEGERHLQYQYIPDIDADGRVAGFYSMVNDITAIKQVEQKLNLLARFDSLTGLPNRNQLHEKLAEAIARADRSGQAMAAMFIDIDHFKPINDSHGHHAGDLVLHQFAQRLLSCIRQTDTAARLAGDEFVILLEGLHRPEEAALVAEKIVCAMQPPFRIYDTACIVTASVGIAVRRADERDPQALLRRADEALYAAKAAGRNTYRVHA
ncbi:MAG: CHASE domain-containing protein [Burkholderiaceae bacterium]